MKMILFALFLITISGIHADIRLEGNQDTFAVHEKKSNFNYFSTLFGWPPVYKHNKFNIGRELGYTSWQEFIQNYKTVEFDGQLRIKFARSDKEGTNFDVLVSPPAFQLSRVLFTGNGSTFESPPWDPLTFKRPSSAGNPPITLLIDIPFFHYHHTIFSETIWVGASRMHAEVHVTMEGYMDDNQLMLAAGFKHKCSQQLTPMGRDLEVTGFKAMIFKQ